MEQFYNFVLTIGLCGLLSNTVDFIGENTTQPLLRGDFPKSVLGKVDFWARCLIWNPTKIYVLYVVWETLL